MPYCKNDDTIFAPATIPGTGAITLIRVSGPQSIQIAEKIVTCPAKTSRAGIAEAEGYTIKFGSVYLREGELLDDVLVSVFRTPHSYTGEDSVEISCHASTYIFSELSRLLAEAGARPAEAGEFTMRAFLNGKMDLTQAEAVADVIASQSAAAHRIAVSQLRGGFSNELRQMREELLRIASLMELELDFSEEDVEFADRRELDTLLEKVIAHMGRLAESFRLGNAIRNGVPTAIVGATNVGKSTLLNALLGEERAIVSDIHGTTRDTIEETLNIDGVLFRLIDTAGLRDANESIERIGIERTLRKISEARILLCLVDGSLPPDRIRTRISDIFHRIVSPVSPDTPAIPTASAASATPVTPDSLVTPDSPVIPNSPATADTADSPEMPDCSADRDGQSIYILINKTDLIDEEERRKAFETELLHLIQNPENIENRENLSQKSLKNYKNCERVKFDNGKNGELMTEDQYSKNIYTDNISVPLIDKRNIKLYFISAKTGMGLDALKYDLAKGQKDKINTADTVTVTNIRHFHALHEAGISLQRVRDGLHSGLPTDLLSQDLREAVATIGTITGVISADDVLNSIFSRFCIGK